MIDDIDSYFEAYQDRGIKKWNGFFLSEHTAIIANEQEKSKCIQRFPQLDQKQIDDCLNQSINYNKRLTIQLNTFDALGRVQPFISGVCRGFVTPETILIDDCLVEYNDIRHIRMADSSKWFEVQTTASSDPPPPLVDEFCEDYFTDGDFID